MPYGWEEPFPTAGKNYSLRLGIIIPYGWEELFPTAGKNHSLRLGRTIPSRRER